MRRPIAPGTGPPAHRNCTKRCQQRERRPCPDLCHGTSCYQVPSRARRRTKVLRWRAPPAECDAIQRTSASGKARLRHNGMYRRETKPAPRDLRKAPRFLPFLTTISLGETGGLPLLPHGWISLEEMNASHSLSCERVRLRRATCRTPNLNSSARALC